MIASYFGLCVWLVPFALFVSLSAGDNVLPTMGSEPVPGGGESRVKPQGMVKALVDYVRGGLGQVIDAAGWLRRDRGDKSDFARYRAGSI